MHERVGRTGGPSPATRWRCLTQYLGVAFWAILLAGCSKTVHWEEEVPLNTGETIWVKRSVRYVLGGDSGNPMDVAYRPDRVERLAFTWNQREYRYEGDAVLILLAISSKNQPVLVAPASWNDWDIRHQFACAKPHYVQFAQNNGEKEWSWSPATDPSLYGMKSNLMLQRPIHYKNLGPRYLASDRESLDRSIWLKSPHTRSIDANYVAERCKEEKR